MRSETTTKGTTTMFAVGSRWAEASGFEFDVLDVLDNGAISVRFVKGGWRLMLAASEASKWTAVATEFARAA